MRSILFKLLSCRSSRWIVSFWADADCGIAHAARTAKTRYLCMVNPFSSQLGKYVAEIHRGQGEEIRILAESHVRISTLETNRRGPCYVVVDVVLKARRS